MLGARPEHLTWAQLVALLGCSLFYSAQRPLLILTLVVFGASIYVVLAVAQHGVDEHRQLVRRGGDGLGRSQVRFLPAQEGPQGAVGAVQPVGRQARNAAAARLALGLVLDS